MAESKLNLMQKKNPYESIHNLSVIFIFTNHAKDTKKDAVTNAREEIANSLEFIRDGMYYSRF